MVIQPSCVMQVNCVVGFAAVFCFFFFNALAVVQVVAS